MTRRILAALVFVWGLGAMASAGTTSAWPDAPFNQANELYEKGRYGDAAAAYEKIVSTGAVSAALFFNEGNAYFKAGKLGLAIEAYRRAAALAPRDPDIKANLRFVREQVKAPRLAPPSRWTRWSRFLTLNEWSALWSVAVAGWFLTLAARVWNPRFKSSSRALPASIGVAALGISVALGGEIQDRLLVKTCVIVTSEAVARRGPFPESQSYYTAPDGEELRVVEERGDWVEVIDGSQRTGWAPRREMAILTGGV